MKGRKTKTETQSCVPLAHSINALTGWHWARPKPAPGNGSGFLRWWARTKYLSHHLVLPRVRISRKLDVGAGPGLQLVRSDTGHPLRMS